MKHKECSIADTATIIIRVCDLNREILRSAESDMMAEVGAKDFRGIRNTDIIQRLILDGHKARKKIK